MVTGAHVKLIQYYAYKENKRFVFYLQRALSLSEKGNMQDMEPIKEEDTPPQSANETPTPPPSTRHQLPPRPPSPQCPTSTSSNTASLNQGTSSTSKTNQSQ